MVRPRPLYAHQYRIVNNQLNLLAFELAHKIESEGYNALSIPASEVTSEKDWTSFISHKAVAREAGLGWIGKSLLLVNENYGPRIRMATVLTDMAFDTGKPVKNNCEECRACVDRCPAGAIRNSSFETYPNSREDAFDAKGCASLLQEFADDPRIESMVCGICIQACPWRSD